jgi:general stress protein YciG
MEPMKGQGQITVTEAGRKGGTTTRDRHGSKFYQLIGRRGGKSTKKLYVHLLKEFGKRGGRPRRPVLNKHMGEEGQ